MESSELQELFEKHNSEYLKFERIPEKDRLHPNRTLCGYLKLATLHQDPKDFSVAADHDIVYLATARDLVESVTEQDVIYLRRCGIHYSTESGGLANFC